MELLFRKMLDQREVLSLLKKVFIRSNDGEKLTYTGEKNFFVSFVKLLSKCKIKFRLSGCQFYSKCDFWYYFLLFIRHYVWIGTTIVQFASSWTFRIKYNGTRLEFLSFGLWFASFRGLVYFTVFDNGQLWLNRQPLFALFTPSSHIKVRKRAIF